MLLCMVVIPGRADAPQNRVPKIPASVAVEDPPVFPLSQVKRGLKGFGYTVFASADGPERNSSATISALSSRTMCRVRR